MPDDEDNDLCNVGYDCGSVYPVQNEKVASIGSIILTTWWWGFLRLQAMLE